MQQPPTRIRWHRPVSDAGAPTASIGENPPDADDRDAVLHTLLGVGVPVVEGVETAVDLAIGLLRLAAEVEHALMVQYLYAAGSLRDEPGPDSVNYREKLMDVAIQEMGHLATVQNLLLLVGGRDSLYLQRDPMRESSEKNPLPLVLEPVGKIALAKYVAAEKPAHVPPDLAAEVDNLVELAKAASGVEPHRVGAIYELLTWMFTPSDEAREKIDLAAYVPLPERPHLSPEDLQDVSEISLYEALPEEWQVFEEDVILATVHNCAEARSAIARIAEQGEGLEHKDVSHFGEFMEMVAAFDAGMISVTPIAKSPTLGDAPGGKHGEVITHRYTRLWGEVFSLQYSLLILTIYHALATPRPSNEDSGLRGALTELALRGMRRVIGSVSDLIGSLPLHGDGRPGNAGPPYDLDPSILASGSDEELRARHLLLLDRLEKIYRAVETSPEFATHPAHANVLKNLRNFDTRRRNLFA